MTKFDNIINEKLEVSVIHSLSGGIVKGAEYNDFAKVEIAGEGAFWYIDSFGISVGDYVTVPLGKNLVEGKVLRVDKHVSSQASPVPVKRARKIVGFRKNRRTNE